MNRWSKIFHSMLFSQNHKNEENFNDSEVSRQNESHKSNEDIENWCLAGKNYFSKLDLIFIFYKNNNINLFYSYGQYKRYARNKRKRFCPKELIL